MADKKKKSKSRRDDDMEKPTKEECAVAKHLRFGLETKEAKLVGMTVKYFIASEAVDKLMESKWATNKNKQDNLFNSRQSCVSYLDRLLNKGMFHRALRAERKKKEDKIKKKDSEVDESQDDKKVRRRKKEKKEEVDKSEKEETEDTKEAKKEEKKEEKSDEKKKKEKKVKLRMHDDQIFLDGDQVYVWIYDPVNVKTFIIGLLMVLGTIGLCLFPLWPPIVRQGVYYCSLAGAVFVGFILLLAVARFILFCIIWLFSGGKHHFWFLPNLTEDVGFFDSFKPLYTYSYKGPDKTKTTEKTEKQNEKTEMVETTEKVEKEKLSDVEKSDSSDNGYEIVDKSEVTDEE